MPPSPIPPWPVFGYGLRWIPMHWGKGGIRWDGQAGIIGLTPIMTLIRVWVGFKDSAGRNEGESLELDA